MAERGEYVYDWPRPMVTVDAVVFCDFGGTKKILLINRKNEPFKGCWSLPGGFIELEEELGESVARELEEETGLKGVELEPFYTFGQCGRDPRGRLITIAFLGRVEKSNSKVQAGDDAAKAQWFSIEEIPENLGFDHDEIIKMALAKMMN